MKLDHIIKCTVLMKLKEIDSVLEERTSNNFSTKYKINAHVAYGDKDNRFKYGAGYIYLCSIKIQDHQ